jgi:translation initiation factor IF-1
MPGVTARSASKNMSRGKRASAAKNARRVEAALNEELESCTYGKISKALGNKMFLVVNTDKREHLAHIRGKMARISVGDVVLLNIRDYESRTTSGNEVYDIMAVFNVKDVSRLIKAGSMPNWMNRTADAADGDDLNDLFEYEEGSDEEKEEMPDKKDKKNHRTVGKVAAGGAGDDSDIDIDRI